MAKRALRNPSRMPRFLKRGLEFGHFNSYV
jgi:hypothetical protein